LVGSSNWINTFETSSFRQGLSRLIDSYAEGLIDKAEFEPRIGRLRQRIAHVSTQCQQLADEETLQQDLHLIIGRLEAFGQTLHRRLDDIEWGEQREIIRALVKRVELGEDQVQVVFRVEPYLGETDPEKKSLQLCRESRTAALWRSGRGGREVIIFENTRLKPGFELSADQGRGLHFGQ
jgi:site-specific DNA recombinase